MTSAQKDICWRTISSTAFFYLAMDALERRESLSVVRVADGEKALYNHVRQADDPHEILEPFAGFTPSWLTRFGCEGISKKVLAERIYSAVERCTYLAPSMSGLAHASYDLYTMFPRSRYVDNFFPNLWSDEQKVALFQAAGRVLFINASRTLADAMQKRARLYYDCRVEYLPLTNWSEAEEVIERANQIKAALTLFSAGPASKFIGPRIGGVTLDIGQAACRWTFLAEFERRKKIAADAGRLAEYVSHPYANEFDIVYEGEI